MSHESRSLRDLAEELVQLWHVDADSEALSHSYRVAMSRCIGDLMGAITASSEIREPEEWLDGVRVYVEHGWLCIRTAKGWLLWNAKIEDMPDTGLLLEDAMKLAKAEYLENGQ